MKISRIKKKQNKKGNVASGMITIIIIVFALALFSFVGYNIMKDLNSEIQSDSDMKANTKNTSQNLTDRFPAIFDGGLMFLFVLLWIATLVSAYLIDTSPIFFIVSVVVFLIVIIFAFALGNVYDEFILDPEFQSVPTDFPMTDFLLSNIKIMVVVVGFSIMMVLYSKFRSGR